MERKGSWCSDSARQLLIENAIARADEFFGKGHIEKATAFMLEAIKQAPGDRSLYFRTRRNADRREAL